MWHEPLVSGDTILVRCLNLDQVTEAGSVGDSSWWQGQPVLFPSARREEVWCPSRVGSGHDACWDIQCQMATATGFSPAVVLAAESFPCVCLFPRLSSEFASVPGGSSVGTQWILCLAKSSREGFCCL